MFFKYFANFVLFLCPGFETVILPLIGKPKRDKSPITSSNLCRAGSFLYLSFKLLSIPPSSTFILVLLNVFARKFNFSSEISSSTKTIALFTLPPLIRSCFINCSNSCKKQNVREEAIFSLNSDKLSSVDVCIPKTLEL